MKSEKDSVYRIGDFFVLVGPRLLRQAGGEQVPLTPKVFDTLLYLVENAGRLIEKDELMREIWPDTIVEENNLNKNISVLRRILGEKQGENRFIATVPGRGYKFVAPVTVLEPEEASAVEASGSNELTKDIAPSADVDLAENPPSADAERKGKAGPRFLKAIAAVTIAAFVAAAAGYYFTRPRPVDPPRTIAVLPFKPLAAENRDEVMETGMADTLIARLGSDPELIVRPLSSVRRYSGLDQDPLIAGRELGVETVLDGSLQRSGNDIRVNARLMRTSDGSSLWSETFDEKFTDIFALQDKIANKIAEALKTRLGTISNGKRSTDDLDAYRLYLQGRYHALKSTPPEIRQGIEFYRQAIAADPNYALAYAGMAQAFAALPITSDVPPNAAFPQAKAAAVKALEIDPDLPEARMILGVIEFWFDWQWEDAQRDLKKAVASNPNDPDAHRFYSVMLISKGRFQEAIAEIEVARQLDPLSLIANALKAQALFYSGFDADAIVQANKTLEIEPNFWIAHLMLARICLHQNRFEDAIAEAKKAEQFSGGNSEAVSLRAYALAQSGRRDEAQQILADLLARSERQYVPDYNLAMIYNGLGDKDAAIDRLEKALASRDARMILLKVEPKWNGLRSDPRFAELMTQVDF